MSTARLGVLVPLVFGFAACDTIDPTDPPDLIDPPVSECAPRDAVLPTAEELLARGIDLGYTPRPADPDSEDGGLAFTDERPGLADAVPSLVREALTNAAVADTDGDCLTDLAELAAGTSPTNPDTDGDGWFDGPCNERRKLVLVRVTAHDEQEDVGDDELYVITDDRRFPTSDDLDGYWNFDDGDSRAIGLVLAQRVRGTNTAGRLMLARLEGWEDDPEVTNTWWADDLLFSAYVNLGAYAPGQVFTVRKTYSDWDYALALRVDVQRFADPDPTFDGDADDDGIKDSAEFQVARDLGGITDPYRPDVLVELDWMPGRALETRARRLVTTRLATQGITLQVRPSEQIARDSCLTRGQARTLYETRFQAQGYRAFRYAVMGEVLWNDASGVAVGDAFFVDDSTWWISGLVLPQAGTFLHELGHTMGLTKDIFRLIDTVGSPSYDSAMNYFYQPSKVDYSHDGLGGTSNDHDDWDALRVGSGLRYSFGASKATDAGVCR